MSDDRQYPLPLLPAKTALGREDYFVSSSNALAVSMLENWRHWPDRKFLLIGPAGAGKTHLAHVWAAESGARLLAAQDLTEADVPALADAPLCIEDIDEAAGDRAAEEAAFHLHNLVLAQGHALLLTAATPPLRWSLSLPDLQSRLMGTQLAGLSAPDDALLAALLGKQFLDRQLTPPPDVISYLLRRMRRSHDSARRVVAVIDALTLSRKGKITIPVARDALASLEEEDGTGQE